jgi:NTE family protein
VRETGSKVGNLQNGIESDQRTAVVFAGGLSLAAYHAGAFEVLTERSISPSWVTGSSAGAVTAALIAGNLPKDRVHRLRSFWNLSGNDPVVGNPSQHTLGWLAAISAHVFGRAGYFHPRAPFLSPFEFRSLYDLAPMRHRLKQLIDFNLLNSGAVRISVAATDVETGEPIIYDSSHGPICIDHLMASCGFLPDFAPVAIEGRHLVDGGLALNAPFDPILETDNESFRLFVLDLFPRDGERPRSLETAAERKSDLMFGNQTVLRLKDKMKIRALQRKLSQSKLPEDDVFLLSYRAGRDEPGPEKSYNFSRHSIASRWRAGRLDMLEALTSGGGTGGLRVIRRQPRQ